MRPLKPIFTADGLYLFMEPTSLQGRDVRDRGSFATFAAFSKHVKLSFVCETYLEPVPPSGMGPERQALDLTETDELDEEQLASWVRQAAANPGMGGL